MLSYGDFYRIGLTAAARRVRRRRPIEDQGKPGAIQTGYQPATSGSGGGGGSAPKSGASIAARTIDAGGSTTSALGVGGATAGAMGAGSPQAIDLAGYIAAEVYQRPTRSEAWNVLGAQWVAFSGTWSVAANQAKCTAVGAHVRGVLALSDFVRYSNCSIGCIIPTSTDSGLGICLRADAATGNVSGYYAQANTTTGDVHLYRIDDDALTLLGTAVAAIVPGNKFGLRRDGPTLTLSIDLVDTITVAENTYPDGRVGLIAGAVVSQGWDNVTCGAT